MIKEIKKDKRALFLDRDGVINRQVIGGYVTCAEDFEFLPGVLKSLKILSSKFDYVIIVTNQQGISKGLFSEKDLENVHHFMLKEIENAGGRIDQIYVCTALEEENNECRKPNTGMGRLALKDFPEIDLKTSVMVGDFLTDMIFGKKLELKTVFLTKGNPIEKEVEKYADEIYKDLAEYSENL